MGVAMGKRGARAKGSRKDSDNTEQAAEKRAAALFDVLDVHDNGRITLDNLRKVAKEYGVEVSTEELTSMMRHWDSSGTMTLSVVDFRKLFDEVMNA